MKKSKLISIIIGVIAIMAIVIYLVSLDKSDIDKDDTGIVKITDELIIGYPNLRIALPVIVAQDKGYFKEQGLNIRLKSYETAQPMMDAIVSDKIKLGGFCALPITFGAMARSKTELYFLGGMYEDNKHPISVLLIKDTINIKNVKDLKGKKIGILPTRAYEVWLQGILKSNNVNPKDVIIRQVKPNIQADALNNGSIDALFTNDPAATITMSKGYGYLLTKEALVPKSTDMTPFYFGSFNVRKEFADKNPEIIKKVSYALNKASKYINEHPEAKLIMSTKDYLPEAFRPIVKYFPDSYFKPSNEVTNSDLERIKDYYLKKQILPVNIDIRGLQYQR